MYAITRVKESPFRPADAFEVLSNPTRKRMLEVLRAQGPCEVLDLADQLGISNLKLYNHLDLLEESGLVRLRKTKGHTVAKFRPIGWARLKKQWENGMAVPRNLSVVR